MSDYRNKQVFGFIGMKDYKTSAFFNLSTCSPLLTAMIIISPNLERSTPIRNGKNALVCMFYRIFQRNLERNNDCGVKVNILLSKTVISDSASSGL